jgi:hypothetical protein
MPRSYVTLAGTPGDMIRLACTKCERRGQYRKATLMERYGPDQNTVDLLAWISAYRPRWQTNQITDQVRMRVRRSRSEVTIPEGRARPFLTEAEEFYSAAEKLGDDSFIRYYLLCHATELVLKA